MSENVDRIRGLVAYFMGLFILRLKMIGVLEISISCSTNLLVVSFVRTQKRKVYLSVMNLLATYVVLKRIVLFGMLAIPIVFWPVRFV